LTTRPRVDKVYSSTGRVLAGCTLAILIAGCGGSPALPTLSPTLGPTVGPSPTPTPRSTPSTPTPSSPVARGTFTLLDSVPLTTTDFTATRLPDGRVLIVGRGEAQLFDPNSSKFTAIGSASEMRADHAATLLPSGRVLITGGVNGWGEPALASAEIYDPTTGRFSLTGSMSVARENHTATLLPDGRVLVAGGDRDCFQGCAGVTASAEIYDPSTGAFSRTGSLRQARTGQTGTLLANGTVLIAGGDGPGRDDGTQANQPVLPAELYEPSLRKFVPTGSMTTARDDLAATLLLNGQVLFAGGSQDTSAELYDPTLGRFHATGSMSSPRSGATATLLPNGQVLVTGGNGDVNTSGGTLVVGNLASAELYDSPTGRFILTGSMTAARWHHVSTLLADGRVLILEGQDSADGQELDSAELYQP
jgi:hypothetical protein